MRDFERNVSPRRDFFFVPPTFEGIKFRDFKACFQNEFLTLTPAIFFLRSPLTKEPYMEKIRELQIINSSSSKIMNIVPSKVYIEYLRNKHRINHNVL